MSHDIDTTKGRAAMAFKGDKPWWEGMDGLHGHELKAGASLEDWQKASGLDYTVKAYDAWGFVHDEEEGISMPESKILVRTDSRTPLSVVSDKYKIFQPGGCLEFFRDLVSEHGFELETAGALRGGRRYWALANTQLSDVVGKGDTMKAYVLLSSSCDGSMATRAQFTSVRVVCQNTLSMALARTQKRGKNERDDKGANGRYSVSHSREFDMQTAKHALGLASDTFGAFMDNAKILAKKKLDDADAISFFCELANVEVPAADEALEIDGLAGRLFQTYKTGIGQDLATAKGTAWGLVNAVTRYYDHEKEAVSTDNRMNRAWFGDGARMKTLAWSNALAL